MTEAKRYPVATIEQMAEIPLDALPRFVAELPSMLAQVMAIKAMNEILAPLGAPLELGTPIWIDDYKHTGTMTFTANGEEVARFEHDTRTGERKSQ